ncbi:type II toxin-antitoxin system RelE/ParE family toxin [Desulfurivibrio sp. D14AmB]|uniref:type II toxin-antitoxin system RelE/ParE family toxin n=1 Tax=Desulfurivibrio sp. D14AmB TaxID=3374370 RepID=UPI00376EFAE8
MKLQWSDTAVRDLISIRRYIAEDKPTAAKTWVERLKSRAKNARHSPWSGRIVPELANENIREFIEGRYRIVYQVHENHVSILTVFEAHRLFPTETSTTGAGKNAY